MIKSILVIMLAILAFVLLILAMAKRKHSRYSDAFFYCSVVIAAVGGFILYGCAFSELTESIPLAVVNTVFATLKMFLVSNDYGSVKDAVILQSDYVVSLFWLLHLLALYSTANAILTTLGMPVVMVIRAGRSKLKKNVVIIYGITPESIELGRKLLRQKQHSVLYIDKNADNVLLNGIMEMGGLYYLNNQAVQSETGFIKGIGINKKKNLMVYALGNEEADNYDYAMRLKKQLDQLDIPTERTSLTLLANMELPYGRTLQAFDKKYGFGSVLVIDRAYLVARSLVKQFPPCNYVAFNRELAKAKDNEAFHAVIVGFGSIGQAILKNLVINGQFENAGFHVAVFDPDYQSKAGYMNRNCSGLMENYDIAFYEKSGQSLEFYQYIEENAEKIDYIVVCTGNEKTNNEIAIAVENTLLWKEGKASVFRCSYDDIICQHIDTDGTISYEKLDIYTQDNLDVKKFDQRAMRLNHIYCGGVSEEEDWKMAGFVDRMSSRASADFAPVFLNILGCSKEDVLERGVWEQLTEVQKENLSRTEHLRWCAFYYSIGYQRMSRDEFDKRCQAYMAEVEEKGSSRIKIQKDFTRRLHICLVTWEELDELTEEYRKITGDRNKDYKQDDTNNVMMLPKLLQS